jgi:Cytochrome c554 and c-prime
MTKANTMNKTKHYLSLAPAYFVGALIISVCCIITAFAAEETILSAGSHEGDQEHEALFNKTGFPSAQECGRCHMDHYREWSVSRHAYAQLSPTFLAYQATLVKLTNGTLGDFCERCHTQVGMSNAEPIIISNSQRGDVALEGITCVVCHRVPEAYGKITGRLPVQTGDVEAPVYGPRDGNELQRVIEDQSGKPLKVHRKAHLLSQVSQPGFCGRCHDVRLVNGFRLEDAFSEYKQTPAAQRGETCQDCHMGPIPGIASTYPPAPAAIIRGVPTKPARRTNHMFVGVDSPLVHPGIFPIDSEAQEYATPAEWLSFDYKAGWGTPAFEKNQPDESLFSGFWKDPEERVVARGIIDRQLALRAESHRRGTTLVKNGYGLGDVKFLESGNDLRFSVQVKNLTDGHSVPTGLIAERNVWLQVTVSDTDGQVIYRSGDLDPNGDVRDQHSLYVSSGAIPRDKQLFNLRSPFMVRNIHGGEREQVLPANYSIDPLIFMRPEPKPSLLFGGIRDIRIQKTNIEASGSRWASYSINEELLTAHSPYTINIKLVVGQLPPHLIHAISGQGFEYGLSARAIADAMVEFYRVIEERNVIVE